MATLLALFFVFLLVMSTVGAIISYRDLQKRYAEAREEYRKFERFFTFLDRVKWHSTHRV